MNKNKLTLSLLIFIVFSVGYFSSCKKKKTCPYGQKKVGKQCICKLDSNCPEGMSCKNGKCELTIKKTTCPDVPCKDGKVCDDGNCRNCLADSECGNDKFCDNGKCKTKGDQCNPDKDCPLGQKCKHGYCVKDEGPVSICSGNNCATPCVMNPIYFNYKESALDNTARKTLKKDVQCLKTALSKGFTKIHLVGLCDPRGPTTYNDDLASQRIKTVLDELSLIDPSIVQKIKITTEPLGETCAEGTDEVSWRKDRRVEFMWNKKSGQVCP